jgi:hypothetical protein
LTFEDRIERRERGEQPCVLWDGQDVRRSLNELLSQLRISLEIILLPPG